MSALGFRWTSAASRDGSHCVHGTSHEGGSVTFMLIVPDQYGQVHAVTLAGRAVTEADRMVIGAMAEQARKGCSPGPKGQFGGRTSPHRLRFCQHLANCLNRVPAETGAVSSPGS